jgi:hypothetical protein
MRHTESENIVRKELVGRALADTASFLASAGVVLTAEQSAEVHRRVGLSIAKLHRDESTEALDLLVCASLLQAVGEVTGILAPADPLVWKHELVVVGAEAARDLMAAGGYPRPTPAQLKLMACGLERRAEPLARRGMELAPEHARQRMRDTAAQVVLVALGDPPSRMSLN